MPPDLWSGGIAVRAGLAASGGVFGFAERGGPSFAGRGPGFAGLGAGVRQAVDDACRLGERQGCGREPRAGALRDRGRPTRRPEGARSASCAAFVGFGSAGAAPRVGFGPTGLGAETSDRGQRLRSAAGARGRGPRLRPAAGAGGWGRRSVPVVRSGALGRRRGPLLPECRRGEHREGENGRVRRTRSYGDDRARRTRPVREVVVAYSPIVAPKRAGRVPRWVLRSSSIDTVKTSCTSSDPDSASVTPMRATG